MQALTGSTRFSERPKQTQNCSRQVLESSSKVSYVFLRGSSNFAKDRFVFACPCIHAAERFQTGRRLLYDRREAKTDSELLQTGLRELQKGFIFS